MHDDRVEATAAAVPPGADARRRALRIFLGGGAVACGEAAYLVWRTEARRNGAVVLVLQ